MPEGCPQKLSQAALTAARLKSRGRVNFPLDSESSCCTSSFPNVARDKRRMTSVPSTTLPGVKGTFGHERKKLMISLRTFFTLLRKSNKLKEH